MSFVSPVLPASPVRPGAALPLGLRPSDPPRRPALGSVSPGSSHSILQALRDDPVLGLLPEPLLGLLSVRAQLRRYGRDDTIVQQDGQDASLYVLRRGRAHVERVGHNQRVALLGVLERGAWIGEYNLLDGQAHNATVRCVQPSEVLVLRGTEVLHCQSQCPEFSHAWTSALVRRVREANRRITSMSLDGVRERVLWQLAQWSELSHEGERVVSSRIGRSELARMVGASREMVCRVLRGLQAAGQIELRRDRSIALRS